MSEIYHFVIDPLQFPFMLHALVVAVMVGVASAMLSCFIVLKGWSLMGDAISHAILPGVALAEILGIAHIIGAFFSGILCAGFSGYIHRHSRIKETSVMGIVFAGMFALGILMAAQVHTDKHLMHLIIRGNLLGVNNNEFVQILVICSLVIMTILLKWRDFMLHTFDVSHARVVGLPTTHIYYALLIMLSMVIVVAIQAVGVIMIVSLLITPGIMGQMLSKSFAKMMGIAVTVSILSAFFGVLVSFYLNASTAACIVLLQSIGVIVVILLKVIKLALKNVIPV